MPQLSILTGVVINCVPADPENRYHPTVIYGDVSHWQPIQLMEAAFRV